MSQHGNVVLLHDGNIAKRPIPSVSELSTRIRGEIYMHLVEYGQTREPAVVVKLMELVELYANAKHVEMRRR